MNHWTGFSRTAIAAAVAIVAVAPALAQNTTSAVGGRITDADGKPVAGATVTIVHVESGSTTNLTTDAEGRYAARALRPGGPYTITVTKGSLTEKRSDVFLNLAEALAYDAQLGAPAQTIVVTGRGASDKFNRSSMGAGTNIGARELAAQASIARNLQDYARNDPRLSQTDKERGEISALGQNSRYNKITIDGVTVSDTFGLEANTLPTAKQPISIDAIQSVQVNLSNYDVTQKGYTGANINAVTKSGTNDLHGSVYYVWRDDSQVGQRFNRQNGTYFLPNPFKETTKGFTLGGPILKDKLFFFVNYEELKSNRVQPEFGPVAAGATLPAVAISQSFINAMSAAAKSQYGFDPGQAGGSGALEVKDYLAKLDWNISDTQRASVRFSRTEQQETNNGSFNINATSLQMTSQWWTQKKKVDTLVGQWFADWTPDFSTELKLSKRDYNSVPQNNSRLPAMSFQFTGAAPIDPNTGVTATGVNTGSRFLNFGTEQSRHFNVLDTKTLDAYAGATWNVGDHELKFGADVADNKVYNAFFQNTFGNYTFGCTNESATYLYDFNGAATNFSCATATAAQMETALLENFAKGRPNSYQVQTAAAGYAIDDGIAKWRLRDTGVFLQDTWKFGKNFTLTVGARLDQLNTGEKPPLNVAAAAPTVAGSVNTPAKTVVRNTGGFGRDNTTTVDGESLFQPRIGFNWNLGGDLRKQVRGGFGLFQGEAASVWLSNPYSNAGLATRIIGCGGAFAACSGAGGVFSANPDGQLTNLPGTTPAANVDYLQPGLGQPSVWKANLAFESELPWAGMVAGAEWVYTKNKTGIYYQHLNLGAPTATGSDGRELYYTPQGYDAACWSVAANQGSSTLVNNTAACNTTSGSGARNRALSNASFNNVLLAAKSDKGSGNSLTVSLSKPARDGLSWQVAYTRASATEVSPLTSSVSNSNFNARSVFNPNEDVAANSAYLIRDRVNGSLSFSKALIGKYRTTVGVFYEGRKGKPYSWTYRNDMNGDAVAGNDLMYIPTGPGSGEVEFFGANAAAKQATEDKFWQIVGTYKELNGSRGHVVKRGGSFSPFVNNFDVRISQEVPGFTSEHKGTISFDILNFGNFLDRRWGRINEMGFQSAGGNRRTFVSTGGLNAAGKYIYAVGDVDDYTLRQAKGESQWAMQVTLKYEF